MFMQTTATCITSVVLGVNHFSGYFATKSSHQNKHYHVQILGTSYTSDLSQSLSLIFVLTHQAGGGALMACMASTSISIRLPTVGPSNCHVHK